MTDDEFWRYIDMLDWSKTGDDSAVIEPAVEALSQLPESEIERFSDILATKLYALDTEHHARHLGADSYVGEEDYFSPELFLRARCGVVAGGRDLYESVREDPREMLEDLELEALLDIAASAFERRTGDECRYEPEIRYETFSNLYGWRRRRRRINRLAS